MTAAEDYRKKAAEINASAKLAATQQKKLELEHLARAYLRLAQQAERNASTDLSYGPSFYGSPTQGTGSEDHD